MSLYKQPVSLPLIKDALSSADLFQECDEMSSVNGDSHTVAHTPSNLLHGSICGAI